MARKRGTASFERALEEFEQLVARMEEGNLSLEESLKAYERGMTLSRQCQAALEDAQQRVQTIGERQTSTGATEPDNDDDA